MEITHKKSNLGVKPELHDITQEQVEKYQALVTAGGENAQSAAFLMGLVMRSAITAGFLTGVTLEEVSKMKPWAVTFVTKKVMDFVKEQTEIPPE